VSYSSRDRSEIDGLLSALHRAHEDLWFDEELGGGDVWWRMILERIRGCDVFIFAMSRNSLSSKPCLAELRYAQDLQRPILPVQIGPVDSMRVTPVAAVEAIDFQNPTVDSGIRLITAVREARRRLSPLPTPLPAEPSVPFAYLMRLATAIAGPELGPQQQAVLLSELTAGLDEDGNDAAARSDITALLHELHDRSDVTYRTRADVESLLASLGSTAGSAGADQVASAHTPDPAHPSKARRSSKRNWIIAAGVALSCVVAAVVALVVTHDRGSQPTPASAPAVAPADLDSILLGATQITTVMGASNMEPSAIVKDMTDPNTVPSDPDCLGADQAAAAPVYTGSGWSAVSAQTLTELRPDEPTATLFWVDQAAVSFPSDHQARAFLNKSADRWKGCSGKVMQETGGNDQTAWTFGDLSRNGDTIAQLSTQEAGGGWACQHVLTAASNAVVEVVACGEHVGDNAERIAAQMIAKARR